jgi:predicted dehydrogenase
MSKPVDLVLMGAGSRGADSYAPYALEYPAEARFVAVAEPNPIRRERFARQHNLPADRCFASWEDLMGRGQLAEGALVCTQDQMHVGPATAAMQAGYDVLLEKPIAPTLAECVHLVQTSERTGRKLQICHVLRYTPFFSKLHEIVTSGRLGDIITVEHRENVAYWHMAHSFVRGNWRNSQLASPMILSKCCHDLDIIVWNMGTPCTHLSSVGSLMHYRGDQVDASIPARCTDGCPIERACSFSAIGTYLEFRPFPDVQAQVAGRPIEQVDAPRTWPFSVISESQSYAARLEALQTGPYGRCVYHSDNDVVDHQVVTMEFEGGPSVVLVMHGHSHDEYRSMRYDGTKATLLGQFSGQSYLTIHDHRAAAPENVAIDWEASGHGGGDFGTMKSFLRSLHGQAAPLTDARTSLESHLLGFAAEEARHNKQVVAIDTFRRQAEQR